MTWYVSWVSSLVFVVLPGGNRVIAYHIAEKCDASISTRVRNEMSFSTQSSYGGPRWVGDFTSVGGKEKVCAM